MALIDQHGRLFGRVNILDFILGGAMVLSLLGVLLVQSGVLVTSGQVVQGETDILMTIQIPKFTTLNHDLFKPGKKTSITIRNQPRGEVLIHKVQYTPVQITVPTPTGKAEAVPDLAQAYSYDFVLQLKDHAKVTKDGYVTEGVKVKVGLPIELEGFDYRVHGKIVDVRAVE